MILVAPGPVAILRRRPRDHGTSRPHALQLVRIRLRIPAAHRHRILPDLAPRQPAAGGRLPVGGVDVLLRLVESLVPAADPGRGGVQLPARAAAGAARSFAAGARCCSRRSASPPCWWCSATSNTPTSSWTSSARAAGRPGRSARSSCRSASPSTPSSRSPISSTATSARRRATASREYCLFVTFFPQLIAGPIVHHDEIMPQFARRRCCGRAR